MFKGFFICLVALLHVRIVFNWFVGCDCGLLVFVVHCLRYLLFASVVGFEWFCCFFVVRVVT